MTINLYESTAQYYDFGNSREIAKDDIDFYRRLFKPSQHILEVGCGTGRVGIELAKAKLFVTGIDLSRSMLNVFESKIQPDISNRIILHQCDMKAFHLKATFDGIIFPFRVFQALRNQNDMIDCLACVKEHMRDSSIAVITLFNPNPKYLNNWGKKGIVDFDDFSQELGCNIRRIQNQTRIDQQKQTLCVEMVYQEHLNGKISKETYDLLELSYLYPRQASDLFKKTGFEVQESYGYYDQSPISDTDFNEQIYLLRKAKTSGMNA